MRVPSTFQGEAAIFDVNYNPKPAYNAMRRDLALPPIQRPPRLTERSLQ